MAAAILARNCIRRQHDADGRAAARALVDLQVAVQRARALLELLEAASPPLTGRVVSDRRLHAAVFRLADGHREALRRSAANRVVHRLADDLVQRRLRLLSQLLT